MPQPIEVDDKFLQFWYGQPRPTLDVSGYPADTQVILKIIHELWGLVPPTHKKRKPFWIDGVRQLQDACAEFGSALLPLYHVVWKAQRPPHTVASPMSLVNPLTGYAGEVRVNLLFGQVAPLSNAEKKHQETLAMLDEVFND